MYFIFEETCWTTKYGKKTHNKLQQQHKAVFNTAIKTQPPAGLEINFFDR